MPEKHADPPVEITLSLPSSLVAKVDLLLWDPVRNRPKYAARSTLVSRLLKEWTEEQQEEENDERQN
ncbi:MAG: hypothetical protein ACE5HV_00010 [Acidobacteriota bacterium]